MSGYRPGAVREIYRKNMFENFDKSEEYRKYVIELQLEDIKLYTVWGTDMLDDENDKLLVHDKKLITFKNSDEMQMSLKDMTHPFRDVDNFEKWVNEEDLKQVYNTNDLRLLVDFHVDFLKEKSTAIDILNCLNLIQDFFIQINTDDFAEFYEDVSIVHLKDFISDNFFWKPVTNTFSYKGLKNTNIKEVLKGVYLAFYSRIEVIGPDVRTVVETEFMENKDHIPKDIHDIMAVERLKYLPFEAIREDVPKLLEWLKDTHWDVAEGIAKYLLPHINEITQELLVILNTGDGMWKYFVICILISRSQDKLDPALIKILKRIAEHPSKIDAEDTVDEAAKMVIANRVLCG